MTVQDQGRQGEIPGEPFEEGVEHGTGRAVTLG